MTRQDIDRWRTIWILNIAEVYELRWNITSLIIGCFSWLMQSHTRSPTPNSCLYFSLKFCHFWLKLLPIKILRKFRTEHFYGRSHFSFGGFWYSQFNPIFRIKLISLAVLMKIRSWVSVLSEDLARLEAESTSPIPGSPHRPPGLLHRKQPDTPAQRTTKLILHHLNLY